MAVMTFFSTFTIWRLDSIYIWPISFHQISIDLLQPLDDFFFYTKYKLTASDQTKKCILSITAPAISATQNSQPSTTSATIEKRNIPDVPSAKSNSRVRNSCGAIEIVITSVDIVTNPSILRMSCGLIRKSEIFRVFVDEAKNFRILFDLSMLTQVQYFRISDQEGRELI